MISRLIFFPVALIVWLFLSWPPDLPGVAAGVVVSLLVCYLAGHLFVGRHHLVWQPHRYLVFLFIYLPLFLWEVFKANIDVALRVASPRLRINPGIVAVKTRLVSDVGLTFLANSITLNPGTMTVDVDRDQGLLYIHWIDVKSQDVEEASRIILGRFEPIIARIFEEGAQP